MPIITIIIATIMPLIKHDKDERSNNNNNNNNNWKAVRQMTSGQSNCAPVGPIWVLGLFRNARQAAG